jgi:hypothetical protein
VMHQVATDADACRICCGLRKWLLRHLTVVTHSKTLLLQLHTVSVMRA